MKTKIRFITDIIVTVLMAISGIYQVGVMIFSKLEPGYELYISISVIMLITAVLFAVDAACVKSERFKIKKEYIESKHIILPIIAVIFAVFSIPVGAVTLFYAPLAILSFFITESAMENARIGGRIVAYGYFAFVLILETSAFVNIHHILEDRNHIVKQKRHKKKHEK